MVEEIYSLAAGKSIWALGTVWGRTGSVELRSTGRAGPQPLVGSWGSLHLQCVQVGQQVLHLLLRHDLAKTWHHVATGKDHLTDAIVVGRHSALRQELLFENSLQAAALLVAGRIWLVAAVAMLIVEPSTSGLLRSQSQFGVALPTLHVAAAEEDNQGADGDGYPRAIAAFIANQRVDQFHSFLETEVCNPIFSSVWGLLTFAPLGSRGWLSPVVGLARIAFCGSTLVKYRDARR